MYLTPDAMDTMTADYRAARVRSVEHRRLQRATRKARLRTSLLDGIGSMLAAVRPASSSPRRSRTARV